MLGKKTTNLCNFPKTDRFITVILHFVQVDH